MLAILQPLQHVPFYLFGTNVIPKKNGKNEVRHNDLYFLDILFYGSNEERQRIPLPSIIISGMVIVAHSKIGKACFGFPRFLTLLFRNAVSK